MDDLSEKIWDFIKPRHEGTTILTPCFREGDEVVAKDQGDVRHVISELFWVQLPLWED